MPALQSTTTSLLCLVANLLTHATAVSSDPMAHGLLHRRATYEGCYSSSTPLTYLDSWTYQSSGHCLPACQAKNYKVAATTGGGDCWCGNEYPALSDKVDLSKCSETCNGFDTEYCGGNGFWTVYPSINDAQVDNYGGDETPSSSSPSPAASPAASSSSAAPATTQVLVSTATAPPTIITSEVQGGQTVLVTVSAPGATTTPTESSTSHGGGGSNTTGIAAGVVVGIVAAAAFAGGLYFFIRNKKRKDAETDYKQRSQVADFMRGTSERKPPGTGYSGMSDQRLDPEAGRRNSVGSLADNHDYSRKILRVANPDSS